MPFCPPKNAIPRLAPDVYSTLGCYCIIWDTTLGQQIISYFWGNPDFKSTGIYVPGLTLKSWWSFEMVIWSWHPRCVFREHWQETTNVGSTMQPYPIPNSSAFWNQTYQPLQKGIGYLFPASFTFVLIRPGYSNPKKKKHRHLPLF